MQTLTRRFVSSFVRAAMLSCIVSPFASSTLAGEHNDVLNIGDRAPDWTLPGIDGQEHTLGEFANSKVVVMVFTCNGCPVAQRYEPRLIQFSKDYKSQGVAVVAVHVHRSETLEEAAQHAKDAGFNFDYVHDESQQVAKSYGAKTTPHLFVLDGQQKIAYMGAIDDNMIETKVKEEYLRQAVDSILAGEKPSLPETRQFGCSVKWK